ncbi:MAG: metallophosphoesterase [Opitutus sp.]
MIRIFSDLHYADRASSLNALPALQPLFEGATEIVLNGDTLDTRPSRYPENTAAAKVEVNEFFRRNAPPTTWITGNHDPDISDLHVIELAERRVFVTHGDVLFHNLVPWSRDATLLARRVNEELATFPPGDRNRLETRFIAIKRAAASIPQRHQAERNALKYAVSFARDTIWPPLRILRVLAAWREAPDRAAALLNQYHFPAKVFVMGHTHRLGVTRTTGGIVVINTGSFSPPSGAGVVDVTPDRVALRSIERHGNEFRLGPTVEEFALARIPDPETLNA